MRSMFAMGIHRPGLGQIESIISAAISAGMNIYKARTEQEMQKDLLKFKEEQANAAAAREAEALRIQQETLKALQTQNAAPTQAAGVPGAPGGDTILGLPPTAFYVGAGLTAGVLVLVTMLLTKGK